MELCSDAPVTDAVKEPTDSIEAEPAGSGIASCILPSNHDTPGETEVEKIQEASDEVVELCKDTKSIF